MKNPCMDCQHRKVGCHSTCGLHLAYKKRLNDKREAIASAKGAEMEARIYAFAGISKRERGEK